MLATCFNLFMLSPTDKCQGICMHHFRMSTTTTRTLVTNNIQSSETPNTTQNSETTVVMKEEPGKLIDYFNNELFTTADQYCCKF